MHEDLVDLLNEDLREKRDVRSVRGLIEDLETAYTVQEQVVARQGPCCGRKVAANAPAIMQAAGLDAPLFGPIFGSEPMAPGVQLHMADYAELALEPEFAAVLAVDIPAGTLLEVSDLKQYVSRFSLAFEVLDKRNAGADFHPATFVVNTIFNAGIVLGTAPLDWDSLTEGSYHAQFNAADDILVDGSGTAPQNPMEACLSVLQHFLARGADLRAGEVVLCGAHHPPIPVKVGGVYEFSLSSGAAVSLSISP